MGNLAICNTRKFWRKQADRFFSVLLSPVGGVYSFFFQNNVVLDLIIALYRPFIILRSIVVVNEERKRNCDNRGTPFQTSVH